MVYRVVNNLSNARVRALWMDPNLRMGEMAALAGCSYDTLITRAKAMGLPSRLALRDTRKFARDDLFRGMWIAGVSAYDMARHLGVSQSAISRGAARMGLPPRRAGAQPKLTLAAFFEVRLAERMAHDAQAEHDALHLAEMVDGRHGGSRSQFVPRPLRVAA